MSGFPIVCVINKNNRGKLTDKYAGVEYTFAPGEKTEIPREVAEHIFGYGLPEKEREVKFRRSGLNMREHGRDIWNRFVIKEIDRGINRVHPSDTPIAA